MKRNIMLAMVIVMMLVTFGGCYLGWEGDGRGRGGGYDRGGRDGGYDRDGGHDNHQRHEDRR